MTKLQLDDYCATFAACLDKPARLPAFIDIANDLPNDIYWGLFRFVWTNTESACLHVGPLREVMPSTRLLCDERMLAMEEDERAALRSMRRRSHGLVRVYRGCTPENMAGFSWTTNKKKAEFFATRYGNEKPRVVSGRVHVDWIVQLFYGRDEKEVFVHPEDVKIDKVFELEPRPRTQADVIGLATQMYGTDTVSGTTEFDRYKIVMGMGGNPEPRREAAVKEVKAQIERCNQIGLAGRAEELSHLLVQIQAWEPSDG